MTHEVSEHPAMTIVWCVDGKQREVTITGETTERLLRTIRLVFPGVLEGDEVRPTTTPVKPPQEWARKPMPRKPVDDYWAHNVDRASGAFSDREIIQSLRSQLGHC